MRTQSLERARCRFLCVRAFACVHKATLSLSLGRTITRSIRLDAFADALKSKEEDANADSNSNSDSQFEHVQAIRLRLGMEICRSLSLKLRLAELAGSLASSHLAKPANSTRTQSKLDAPSVV